MTKSEEPHNIQVLLTRGELQVRDQEIFVYGDLMKPEDRQRIDDRIKELEIRLHNLQACRPQTCIVCQLLKKREEANRIQGFNGGRVIIDDPLNKTSD